VDPAPTTTADPAPTTPVDPTPTPTPPATTPAVVKTPGAPAGVTATEGDGSAVVRWTAPAADGGSPITGYEVQALDLITFDTVGPNRTVPAGTTTLTVTGLTNEMPYWFRVRAVNAAGKGVWSDGSNPVTPMVAIQAPGAPSIGGVTTGNGLAVVRWTAPADNGGAEITGYEVQPVNATTGAAVGGVRRTGPATFQLTVTGLTNGTAYKFRVRAVNQVGAGAQSGNSIVATPRTVPGASATVTATPGAKGGSPTVTVRWAAPAGTGGSAITGFRVTRQQLDSRGRLVGAPTVVLFRATSRYTTYQAPRATPAGTRFRFTVQPVNAVGAGTARSAIGSVR
jgi:hypothetical protein